MTINYQFYDTPYGELILGSYKNKLIMCDWRSRVTRNRIDQRIQKNLSVDSIQHDNEILINTRQQLNEYFNAKRKKFTIPLQLVGTDFQQSVWNELIKIPFGKTISYLELATQLSKPNAVRAVANANGANAISIIIPCHRIIASNGSLGGYAGGIPAKTKLLSLEQA